MSREQSPALVEGRSDEAPRLPEHRVHGGIFIFIVWTILSAIQLVKVSYISKSLGVVK